MLVVACPNCGAKNRVDSARTGAAICGRCKKPLPAAQAQPIILTDDTIDAHLAAAGDKPVLVDCWAAWCGPCRMIAPAVDQLAADSAGRYTVGKLDVDQNPRTASRFRTERIPTLLIFKKGREVDRIEGVQAKEAIAARLMAQV